MRKVETKPTHTTDFATRDNAVDPFSDPVSYLASLGIEAEMVAFVEADLPQAA